MAKAPLYSWWSRYMFWTQRHGYPWIPEKSHLVIGHRGSSDNYPENTMLAFAQAVSEGARGIETDVQKTSDGVYVLIHDSTVDRTTDGSGAVDAHTWAQIAALDAGAWKDEEFADRGDCKIPRLDDFLDTYQGEPVFLLLQSKLGLSDTLAMVDMVVERNMLGQVFIFAPKEQLASVKAYQPAAFVMNDGTGHDPEDLLDQAIRESWNAISPGLAKVSADLAEAANAAGIFLQASFLDSNYETQTQSLIDMGVNFILSNDPAASVSMLESNGIEQIQPR